MAGTQRHVPPLAAPWAEGFGWAARRIEQALGGATVSPRTELFRPLPPDPMAWLFHTFPTYFQNPAGLQVPLAPHHEEFWNWLWAMRPGIPAKTFISIWARGGGKSTSLELASAAIAYFGLRRYVLYICATQKQANDHVSNVATLLETLGVERAVNQYGFARGWSATRLRTADGCTQDAIGMDAASRGVKIDEARPDLIFLDELDEQTDTNETIDKKIEVLTRKILPTGAASLAVCGVQNLPNQDGIFAQLADGRAEFLLDRYVSGPHPAMADLPEQDWYRTEVDADGTTRLSFVGGRPVWQGQGMRECTALLNTIGPRAFAIECLHRIARLEGKLFRKTWFPVVDDWPRQATLVRAWDFASSEEPGRGRGAAADPDWTVGLLLACWKGQFWILNMQRDRLSPKGVKDLVRQTAMVDGRHVAIWLEEEGGSSGRTVSDDYRHNVLVGYDVHTWHSTGSKLARAKPVSSAAEAGNVFVLQAPWNTAFLEEVPKFGLPRVHDDIVDALSLAHYALTLGQSMLPTDFSLTPSLDRMTRPTMERRAQRAEVLPRHVAYGTPVSDPYMARLMALVDLDPDEYV